MSTDRLWIVILFAASSLFAQEPAPAERQAYAAAAKLENPAAKVAALQKFVADYPNGSYRAYAAEQCIEAASKAWPGDASRIRQVGERLVATAAVPDRARVAISLARALAAAGAPSDARQIINVQLKDASARARSRLLLALAEIADKENSTGEASQLRRRALESDPYDSEAALRLAETAAKAGDTDSELRFVAQAWLAHPRKSLGTRLESLYRKTHGQASSGLKDYLDARYRTLFPNPAHLGPYTGPAKRIVLAELMTGAACGPCAGVDLAFDALLERYPQSAVTVLMYHQNRPAPDPMTNPAAIARFDYYGAMAVPTYAIDGKTQMGGGSPENAQEFATTLAEEIDMRLNVAPGAELNVTASRTAGRIAVHATARVTAAKPFLRVFLAEKQLTYSGESGIRFHPFVARASAEFPLESGKTAAYDYAFDLAAVTAALDQYYNDFEKHDDRHNPDGTFRWPERLEKIDPTNLAVVAFVQDDDTKTVMQAAVAEPSVDATTPVQWKPSTGKLTAHPGSTIKARMTAEVAPGWHLYSLKKLDEGPIPTTITLGPGQPFRLEGPIEAPPPVKREDPTFGMEVEYYEGSVGFALPVRIDNEAKPGDHAIAVTARYQTCSDTICLPPKTVPLRVPVSITGH